MAKQYKKLIEFGERKPGAIYEKSRILVHVGWLRRWLRTKINPSGFRREQSYWKHCWDIVTLRVMENGILGWARYADGARADGNTTVYAHDPETNEYIVVTRDGPRSGTI
jgi:hypothetical protein